MFIHKSRQQAPQGCSNLLSLDKCLGTQLNYCQEFQSCQQTVEYHVSSSWRPSKKEQLKSGQVYYLWGFNKPCTIWAKCNTSRTSIRRRHAIFIQQTGMSYAFNKFYQVHEGTPGRLPKYNQQESSLLNLLVCVFPYSVKRFLCGALVCCGLHRTGARLWLVVTSTAVRPETGSRRYWTLLGTQAPVECQVGLFC